MSGSVCRNSASRSRSVVQQEESPLQHGRGAAHGVVPVDFAEHHVPGKHHHLGGRAALVGDRQAVARFVDAQAADQPLLVEVPAVGDARMQAVAHEVVHLVDVDGAGEHAGEQARLRVPRLLGQQRDDLARREYPNRRAACRQLRSPTGNCWQTARAAARPADACLRSGGRTANAPGRAAGRPRSTVRHPGAAPMPANRSSCASCCRYSSARRYTPSECSNRV